MLKDRSELQDKLISPITKIKKSKKTVEDIKNYLANTHQIVDTQLWINNPEELNNLDIRELMLFAEQIFLKTGDMSISPESFFTPAEIKESRQYSAAVFKEDLIDLPYTLYNVLQLSNEEYVCILEAKELNKLMKSNLLYYNLDIQREAKVIKKKDKVIVSPTINMKSVKEITQNLLDGKQFSSELKLNCDIRTSDSGDELIYDAKNMTLTITSGTRISILDGAHRLKAIENAFAITDNINQKFTISITNFNVRQCQLMQSQIAKANRFSVQRIKELEQSRFSDIVVKQLKDESDLKISQSNRVSGDYLVSYNIAADTIDEEFDIRNRAEAADVGDYLVNYFNFLLADVLDNIDETRKTTIRLENSMFVGYIVLARKMMENDLKPKEIRKILKQIDFSRSNPLWRELGILTEKGTFTETNKSRKAIRNYFDKISVNELITNN